MAEERIGRIMNAVASLYSELKSIRDSANWDRKLLAASYLDHRTDYEGTEVEKRTVYDSSAKTYFQVFHDGFLGYLMPEDDVWADLIPSASFFENGERKRIFSSLEALDGIEDLMPYSEKVMDAALSEMADRGYYDQASMAGWDWLILGTAYLMASDDAAHSEVGYRCFDPQEVCIAENGKGKVDVFTRRFRMDARDVLREYRETAPSGILTLVENGMGERSMLDVYEAIVPRGYLVSQGSPVKAGNGKPWTHVVMLASGEEGRGGILSESGFSEFPVACARFQHRNSETPYGTSLAESVLSDIIQLDDMARIRQIMMQKNADPPMAVPYSLQGVYSSRPGARNYVADVAQRPVPIMEGFDYSQMLADIQDRRENLKQSIGADLFRTVLGSTDSRKTAYEVSEKKNEAMTLLMMSIGRFKNEFIDPVLRRTMLILSRQGRLPSVEEVYLKNRRKGPGFEGFLASSRIELSSVFVQRTSAYLHYTGLMTGIQALESTSRIFPGAQLNVKDNDTVRYILYASGMPKSLIRSLRETEAKQKEQAAMNLERMRAEMGVQQGQANKANAEAMQIAGGGMA